MGGIKGPLGEVHFVLHLTLVEERSSDKLGLEEGKEKKVGTKKLEQNVTTLQMRIFSFHSAIFFAKRIRTPRDYKSFKIVFIHMILGLPSFSFYDKGNSQPLPSECARGRTLDPMQ